MSEPPSGPPAPPRADTGRDAAARVTVALRVNGREHSLEVGGGEVLLDTLRERVGLRSPKRGCGQGQCGSCLVLVDGRPSASCAMPTSRLVGREVVTVEGLPERTRATLSRCFAVVGAVQCGFCAPALVIRTHALLLREPDPSDEQIRRALRGHLCRCTGYASVVEAIRRAARVLDGRQPLPALPVAPAVGDRAPRAGAEQAALGEQTFIGDMYCAGMLHAALRLGDHPRARLVDLADDAARVLPGVAMVATAKSLPGARNVGLLEADWPCFVDRGETTAMAGDVIAAVAAEDPWTARRAADSIEASWEPLEPVTTPMQAMAARAPTVRHGCDNVLARSGFRRGSPDAALAGSAHVVRERFTTSMVEHMFLEPEACLAIPHDDGVLEVFSQGQGIYDERRQLARVLGLAPERLRVTLVPTGGAFGGKEDLSIQVQTALLALRTGRPVRLVLPREQSIRLHPKRHPFAIDYELGCDADGRLTAARVRLVADTGAYASVGAKVLERAVGHALGPYRIDHAEVTGLAVRTNNPPGGAMRGFGVGQVAFALEQLVDLLADRVGLDGFQMRELNLLAEGDLAGPGERLHAAAGLRRTLEAVRPAFYGAKLAGIACGLKNVGIGNGERDVGRARIDVLAGGRLRIGHGMSEMGQGLHTVAAQIVREELRRAVAPGSGELGSIELRVSTEDELDCGVTTASRATVLVGRALSDAARKLRVDLERQAGRLEALAGRRYAGEFVCDWTTAMDAPGDDPVLHLSYGFATHVAVLDERTGTLERIVAAHDVGRALNPLLVEAQIQGSLHMGLGIALREQLPLTAGLPSTAVRELGLLRAHELPALEVILVEEPEPHGPFGARGVGEMGVVPVAPAVANALRRYDGRIRTALPMKDDAPMLIGRAGRPAG